MTLLAVGTAESWACPPHPPVRFSPDHTATTLPANPVVIAFNRGDEPLHVISAGRPVPHLRTKLARAIDRIDLFVQRGEIMFAVICGSLGHYTIDPGLRPPRWHRIEHDHDRRMRILESSAVLGRMEWSDGTKDAFLEYAKLENETSLPRPYRLIGCSPTAARRSFTKATRDRSRTRSGTS